METIEEEEMLGKVLLVDDEQDILVLLKYNLEKENFLVQTASNGREGIEVAKYFMPDIRYRQDMGLWLKYLHQIKYAVGIKKTLAIYRIRKESLSRNKKKLVIHQWYFYRKIENLSFITSIYLMLLWAYNGIKKYDFYRSSFNTKIKK